MRKTTKGKGLAGGTAVAAVVAGLALLQSLGLAAVWGALPARLCRAGSGQCGRLSWLWPQVSLRPCSTGGRRSGEVRRTKQKNTDWEQAEQKREAVKSVLISAGFRVGAAALLFCARGRTPWPRLHRVLLWLAVLALITIPFSLVVLRQRLREIEEGELNEARKY